jgi:hypothetical protein
MGKIWAEPNQELPEGWAIARDRPHGLVEAVRRPSPTAIHVLVAWDNAALLEKITAAASSAPLVAAENETDRGAGGATLCSSPAPRAFVQSLASVRLTWI